MEPLRAGVTFQPVDPPDRFVEIARQVEDWGFDYLWVTDSSLHARDVYAYLALAALNTSRVAIGTNCINPHTRHPAVNVNAIVTINEMAGGRAILGIGAGDTPITELGLRVATVKEVTATVEVARRLLGGGEVDYDGPHFSVRRAAIRFGTDGAAPPRVFMTASGPRMLELAGRVADGVLVRCGAFAGGLEFALGHVRAGAEAAGRSLDDIDFGWDVCGSIDEDRDAAQRAARPIATWFAMRSPRYCRMAGISDDLIDAINSAYAGGEFHEARRAHELTSVEMIEKLTIAGTPEDWRDRLEMARDLGVRHVEVFAMGDRFRTLENVSAIVRRMS